MKRLLIVTALLESGAGVALGCCPSVVVAFLLGSGLDSSAGVALGRLAGVALLSLGIANWLARPDAQGRAAKGVVTAMIFYNLGAVVVLGFAGIAIHPVGIALWPAVVLHAAMTVWCFRCVLRKPPTATTNPP